MCTVLPVAAWSWSVSGEHPSHEGPPEAWPVIGRERLWSRATTPAACLSHPACSPSAAQNWTPRPSHSENLSGNLSTHPRWWLASLRTSFCQPFPKACCNKSWTDSELDKVMLSGQVLWFGQSMLGVTHWRCLNISMKWQNKGNHIDCTFLLTSKAWLFPTLPDL